VIVATRGLVRIWARIASRATWVYGLATSFFLNSTVEPFLRHERGWRVEHDRVFDGGLEAVPFFCHHVEQHGLLGVAGHGQVFLKLADVVPVDRTHVAKPQFVKQHPAQQGRP